MTSRSLTGHHSVLDLDAVSDDLKDTPRSTTLTLASSAIELKSSCTACGMLWDGSSGHFCCIVSSESQYCITADMTTEDWMNCLMHNAPLYSLEHWRDAADSEEPTLLFRIRYSHTSFYGRRYLSRPLRHHKFYFHCIIVAILFVFRC